MFVWLTSFRSICGVTKGRASSFLVAEYRPIFGLSGGLYAGVRYAYMRIFFKHVSVGGHLGGSPVWLLWVMLPWTRECRYLFDILFAFLFLVIYPEVELLGHMAVLICFRNLCTVFHNGYTSLQSHHQYTTICFSPHPHYLLSFFCCFSDQEQVMREIIRIRQ